MPICTAQWCHGSRRGREFVDASKQRQADGHPKATVKTKCLTFCLIHAEVCLICLLPFSDLPNTFFIMVEVYSAPTVTLPVARYHMEYESFSRFHANYARAVLLGVVIHQQTLHHCKWQAS